MAAEHQRKFSALAKASQRRPPPIIFVIRDRLVLARELPDDAMVGEDDRSWPLFGWDSDATQDLIPRRRVGGAE